MNLKDAQAKKQIDRFIAEHESDPEGDADKLDALIKRPVQGSGSEVQRASSRAASGD